MDQNPTQSESKSSQTQTESKPNPAKIKSRARSKSKSKSEAKAKPKANPDHKKNPNREILGNQQEGTRTAVPSPRGSPAPPTGTGQTLSGDSVAPAPVHPPRGPGTSERSERGWPAGATES